jgi:hypothetical protein
MKYTGSTPMPDIIIVDDSAWHSVPIACLNENIQQVLGNKWKQTSKYVMMKSELNRITLCLHDRGQKCVLLYFE